MMNYYQKRSFTFSTFINNLTKSFRNMGGIIKTMSSKRISRQFSEKIMLALTSVNKCRYCTLLHTSAALKVGCSSQEISDIFSFNIENLKEDEKIALVFAQTYAQNNTMVSREDLKCLVSYYGKEKAQDILNYIYMFYIGNLTGNTVDAFRSRLNGKPPENGSFLLEFLIYSLGFPLHKILMLKKFQN